MPEYGESRWVVSWCPATAANLKHRDNDDLDLFQYELDYRRSLSAARVLARTKLTEPLCDPEVQIYQEVYERIPGYSFGQWVERQEGALRLYRDKTDKIQTYKQNS